MIGFYLKTILRSFLRNKVASIINFIGLSIAFSLFILLVLFANNELTTDSTHKKASQIYRLLDLDDFHTYTGAKFGPYLNESYPEIEEVCRTYVSGGKINFGDISIRLGNIAIADSNYFRIFTHKALLGQLDNALNDKHSIVLTELTSKKLFGDENPIGKVVKWEDRLSLTVTAVIKDLPINSSLHFDAITSFMSLEFANYSAMHDDGNWSIMTWLLLNDNIDKQNFESKISPDLSKQFGRESNFGLQNLKDIYLNSKVNDTGIRHGNIQLIYLFLGLAFFIIIVASINYINLTTAQANKRAKEVSIRKIIGAHRNKLMTQFLFESIIFVFISLIFGFLLAEFFIPQFNLLANTSLKVKSFYTVRYVSGFIIGGMLLGLISGLYPAIVLSLFHPLAIIKGKVSKSKGSLIVRRILFIFQFAISMIMIVGTIIIYRQVKYVKHLDLGYNKEKVILLHTKENLVKNGKSFNDQLMAIPGVMMTSVCKGVPGEIRNGMGDKVNGEDIFMKHLGCDQNFLELMDIEIIEGHGFTNDSIDIDKTYLLNEAAIRYYGWEDPYSISIWKMKCIGIVKDFNFASLHQPIAPLFISYSSYMTDISIRFEGDNLSAIIQNIETIWKEYYPEDAFNYRFVDDIIDQQYQAEEKLGKIIGYFAIFALLITFLGLFGLTSYMISQQTKEIGIRKVHGGTITGIISMFSLDFLKWLMIAFIISVPISWLLVDYWLQNFSYQVSIDWWVFAVSGIISLSISLITIISLTYRAARMSPVDSLRYE